MLRDFLLTRYTLFPDHRISLGLEIDLTFQSQSENPGTDPPGGEMGGGGERMGPPPHLK